MIMKSKCYNPIKTTYSLSIANSEFEIRQIKSCLDEKIDQCVHYSILKFKKNSNVLRLQENKRKAFICGVE